MPQVILLIGLICLAIGVMFIRHRVRIVIIVPLTIGIIFVLGTIIFPLYHDGPNLTTFYKNQSSILYVVPDTASSGSRITIQTNGVSQTINTERYSTFKLPPATSLINFIAASKNDPTAAFILLPEGTSIQIYPQTQISSSSTYPKIIVEKKQGTAVYITSQNYSPRQLTLSGITIQSGEKNQQQQTYEKNKTKQMQDQGGGIFMQNRALKAINKWIIMTLADLRPQKFQDNIKNFQAFELYEKVVTSRQTNTTVDPAVQAGMFVEAKKGREETQLYQRRHRLFK